MIDVNARSRFLTDKKTETLIKGMQDAVLTAVNSQTQKQQAPSLVIKHEEDSSLLGKLDKISQAMVMIFEAIKKPLILPKIFQVKGEVEVTRPIRINNLNELKKHFDSLENTFNKLLLAIQAIPQPQIKLPKFEIPANKADNTELISLLQELNKKFDNYKPQEINIPRTISIDNFPPQMVPQPVTNININPLQGQVKTTSTTVGTTITKLPGYGQLEGRRAMQIYNNSSNTIYYGGSDVSVSNGIPVTAGSFSNVFDAGYNMIVYGIASTTGNDIRVIEVSKDNSGTIQQ